MGYNKKAEVLMKKCKYEKGSISVFVIVAFIFSMTLLMNIYWTTTNYQITALQTKERIEEIYGNDVNNMENVHQSLNNDIVID